MLCIGGFVLLRPDQGRPPQFSKVVDLDCVYLWDSTTLTNAPPPKSLILKNIFFLTTGSVMFLSQAWITVFILKYYNFHIGFILILSIPSL